jgi:hypothetical protein
MTNWIDTSTFMTGEDTAVPYRFRMTIDWVGDVTVELDDGDWWLVTSNMTVGLESTTADEAKLEALDYLACHLAQQAEAVRDALIMEQRWAGGQKDLTDYEECGDCDGKGHFSPWGKPSDDPAHRVCLSCDGTKRMARSAID